MASLRFGTSAGPRFALCGPWSRAFRSLLAIALLTSIAAADELDGLAKAVDDRPDDKAAYDAYARAAIKAKKFDEAIKKLKVGVARIPDFNDGYYMLAYAYRSKKEWADAADYYRRCITIDPKKADTYFGLGASLQGLGDKKGAISAYDKYVALEKSPDKQRFVDIAKGELVKLDPTRAPPPPPPAPAPVAAPTPAPAGPPRADAAQLRAQADQLKKDGKLEEAISAYQRAIEADRGNVELYNDLGNVYFGMKKYVEAAAAFKESTARDPNFALGWYNLAHALRKGDKRAEAVNAYRSYMRLKSDDPDPYYGLGQTLKSLGDTAGAIEAFRKYVGMEKRPDEQRWVDKARAELEALEAMQRSSSPRASGKIEEKDSGDDVARRASEKLRRELERDQLAPLTDDDIVDPFQRDTWGPRQLRDLKDPFGHDTPIPPGISLDRRRLLEYEAAVQEFRRALSRHAEDVTARYQRGARLAMLADARGATRAWDSVMLVDARVDAARKSVERVRQLLDVRK